MNPINRVFTFEWSMSPRVKSLWGCIRLATNQSMKVTYNDGRRRYKGLNISEPFELPSIFPNDAVSTLVNKVRLPFPPVLHKALEDIDQIESSIRCEVERIVDFSKLAGMIEEADFAEYCVRHIDETMAPLHELRSIFSRQIMALDSENAVRQGEMVLNGAKNAICESMWAFRLNPSRETFNAAITWVTELPHIIRRSLCRILEEEKNLWSCYHWEGEAITQDRAASTLSGFGGFAA